MAKETVIQHNASDYNTAVQTIKEAILRSQYQAAKLVNREMLSLYYGIGRYVSANSRKDFWGTNAIESISERLRKELPGLKGFSKTNLKYMRLFYEEWSTFVEGQCSKSSAVADKIDIDSLLPVKSSAVADHYGMLTSNFSATIRDSRDAIKALNMFKDEYLLDFINTEEIGVRDLVDIDERVVEKEIIHNIKKFIMTFGHDFAFVGNQYHLEVFSEEFFPDLLFFNRELNCLVVVELKTGKFKPGYLAQLMTYLRILDDKVRKPHENPSIGIVLCKTANKDFVEYVIQDYAKPMGVATYRLSKDMPKKLREALPDVEELKKLL